MQNVLAQIEKDLERLIRQRDKLLAQCVALKRENDRLRQQLGEFSLNSDRLGRRVRRSSRKVEMALTRLNTLLDEE